MLEYLFFATKLVESLVAMFMMGLRIYNYLVKNAHLLMS